MFLGPFLSIIREPRLYQNQFLRDHTLNTEYDFSEIFSHSSNTLLKMGFNYLVNQLLWVHFAKKIGCIALLIQYLQVTCAWHIYNTKESRRELATNWRKNEKSFTSRKTVNRSVKWLKKTQTSVEDARQKHVQILEKVYGAQRLVSETSSRILSLYNYNNSGVSNFHNNNFDIY